MARISFIYRTRHKIVTGGHVYEDKFFKALSGREDLDVEYLTAPRIRGKISKVLSPVRNISLLRKVMKSDLVIFNSSTFGYFLPLMRLLKIFGKRSMVIHHHFIYREMEGGRRRIYHYGELAFLRAADYVLTPSPYISEEIKREVGRDALVCPIPFKRRDISGNRPEPQPGRLLCVATIEPRKGQLYLMKALDLLRRRGVPCHLDLVGKTVDKAYADAVRKEAEDAGLDVTFHGYIDEAGMESLHRQADIFVFPSLMEGYGMALNEAMAYGTPVVCFDNSAMPYSVKDSRNGLLVKNENPAALADALEKIITDRELREKLGKGAYAHALALTGQKEFEEIAYKVTAEACSHHLRQK